MRPQHALHAGQTGYPAAPEHPVRQAWDMLSDAIQFASADEIARLVDRALLAGAQWSHARSYGENALVIAVRTNQPAAIPILMARGAKLPSVPDDGVDILMEACSNGHVEMAKMLLDVADISVLESDKNGKTALHFAVIAGEPEIVAFLIAAGADVTAATRGMEAFELQTIFGQHHEMTGAHITSLMIAAAKGDNRIVTALVEAHASRHSGDCAPLIIAARQNHPATVNLLLSKGTRLNQSYDESNRGALDSMLRFHSSIECLRLVVPLHDFSKDDGSADSPLGTAIEIRDLSAIALLLSCGAKVQNNSPEFETLWDVAGEAERFCGEFLDLMAATVCKTIVASDHVKFCDLIEWIGDRNGNFASLASGGVFPSLLDGAKFQLGSVFQQVPDAARQQSCVQAAWNLQYLLPELPELPELAASDIDRGLPMDIVWIRETARRKHAQNQALKAGAKNLVGHCMDKLAYTVTLDFFLECNRDSPDDQVSSFSKFFMQRLTEKFGVPNPIARLVTKAWMSAAHLAKDVASDSLADTNRFLGVLAQNLMRKAIERLSSDELSSLGQACVATLVKSLAHNPAPLAQFCADPVSWLRKLENRSNLRPVDAAALAKTLQVELAVPLSVSTKIATAWQRTIAAAHLSQHWQTPSQLQEVLERKMAQLVDASFSSDEALAVVPLADIHALAKWIATVSEHVPRVSQANKRPADGEPDNAPPRKEPRI